MRRRLFGILAGVLITACTSLLPPAPNTTEADCLALYEQADQVLAQSASQPSDPRRIVGFPQYRIDRFLAEFSQHELDQSATATWLEKLSDLDLQARRTAWQTLPTQWQGLLPRLERCAPVLRAFDLAQPQRLAILKTRASVPDDYITAARIIGLYPLVALPVRRGIQRLHEEFRQIYDLPLAALVQKGQLIRYGFPQKTEQMSSIVRDSLGIPNPTPAQWQSLFARYAPIWEIDTAADYDYPGRPVWRGLNQPGVNSRQPLTFYYPSFTWWQSQPVVQLNYLIWFDRRPLESTFDILGGALDAVLWRVTLSAEGKPLLYDSIHACGCYHLFFPSPALRLRPEALVLPEPPFIAQTAPKLGVDQRLVIRITSATHYIERIYAAHISASDQNYQLVDYAELYQTPVVSGGRRSLFPNTPQPAAGTLPMGFPKRRDGREGGEDSPLWSPLRFNTSEAKRNLFGPNGIVLGSERAERALLWPLGVAEPGAMRERGRHAVAFVGRRHFDDADLLEALFEFRESATASPP